MKHEKIHTDNALEVASETQPAEAAGSPREGADKASQIVEPLDFFGDASLSGTQELTRDMLPSVIWDYANDAAERMGINTGPIAVACLAAASAAIRHGWRIQPKMHDTDWTEPPILWVAITGSSGAKKTSAMNAATWPIEEIDSNWLRRGIEDRKQYNLEMAKFKEAQKKRKKQGDEAIGGPRCDDAVVLDEPIEPVVSRLVVKDTTIESVMKICADNPAGVIQVRDELAEWIASFDLYSGGSGSRDRAKYLTAYNGGRETVDRKSDEDGPLVVHNFAVSVLGGIQDDLLSKKFRNDVADGFLARFLFVKAEVRPGCDRPVNKEAKEAYFKTIKALTDWEVDPVTREPSVIVMSRPAIEFREKVEYISRALNDHPAICKGLSDHINKWPGIFSRLCLVFHMIENALNPHRNYMISEETARRAFRLLTRYFLPEASRIYNDVMQSSDETHRHAKWIADHILARGKSRISTYEIGRAFSAISKDIRAMERATHTLEVMAWIRPDTKKDGTPYSRSNFAKMKWVVNPRVHELFADRAASEKKRREEERARIAAGIKALKELSACNG